MSNGYTNHETYKLKLEIDNTESTYLKVQEMAKNCLIDSIDCTIESGFHYKTDQAKRTLAKELKELFYGYRKVDFEEIADDILTDMIEYQSKQEN